MRRALERSMDGATMHAVAWRVGDGTIASGSLTLEADDLVLRGTTATGEAAVERLALRRLSSIRVGRSGHERLSGRRTVILDDAGGRTIAVAPVGGSAVFELSELLVDLSAQAATRRRLVVVLPLKPGTAERARELVEAGPPFDLAGAELEQHHVFVTEREAIFMFEGADARETVERLIRNPRVVREAARWRECIAGRPRLGDETFSWNNPHR
jgi:hypothetical protein